MKSEMPCVYGQDETRHYLLHHLAHGGKRADRAVGGGEEEA